MAGYALKSIAPDLLDQLNELASNPNRTPFDIARVMKAAGPLKSKAPDEYFMIEGICASLKQRPDLVKAAFEKAIQLGGWNSCVAENYAISLHECGDVEGAAGVIERGLTTFQHDREFLSDAFFSFVTLGKLGRAADIQDILANLNVIDQPDISWRAFVQGLESKGLSSAIAGQAISVAFDEVRRSAARPSIFYSFSTGDAGIPRLGIGFKAIGSVQSVYELEVRVHKAMYEFVEANEPASESGESVLDYVSLWLHNAASHADLHAA